MRSEEDIRAYFADLEMRSRALQGEQAIRRLHSPSGPERMMALEAWQQVCLVLATLQWVLGETEQRY